MRIAIPKLIKILTYVNMLPLGLYAQSTATCSSPQPSADADSIGEESCQYLWQAPKPVQSAYPPSESTSFAYEDQYYNLSCQSQGWQGYFAWSNWANPSRNGDGGVDVTGAPNSVLVEGANSASITLTPGSQAAYELAIPADGFVRFDWSYVGGSSFSQPTFEVSINNETVQALRPGQFSNTFNSSFINTGDTLTLRAEAGQEGVQLRLSNFEFLSNAVGVIERSWTATKQDQPVQTFKQLIAVEKPEINNVLFPESHDGWEAPIIDNPAASGPAFTGFPVIDADGDPSTTDDQINLGKETCSFLATWDDETLFDNGYCMIYRKWKVRDLCGQNTYYATQTITVSGGCPNWGKPIPYLHQVDDIFDPYLPDTQPNRALTKIILPRKTDYYALYP